MTSPVHRRSPADPQPDSPHLEVHEANTGSTDAALIQRARAALAEQETHMKRLTALLAERRALVEKRRELFADFQHQSLATHRSLSGAYRGTPK
jgi:hypothetical protein